MRQYSPAACLGIALAMGTAFSLSGCADAANTRETPAASSHAVSDTPVSFTMLYSGDFNPEYKCLAEMRRLTNVSLEITAIPDSDYDARTQLILNTGEEIPDLLSKTKPTAAQAASGLLLPISDYFDQMPHYLQFIEDNDLQYLVDSAVQADGKIYELPMNVKESKTSTKQQLIRKDIFDKNGIPVPTTYDELYEAAKKLKALYPDSRPIQVVYGNGNMLDMLAPSFGTTGGWGDGPDAFHYQSDTDSWVFAPTSGAYKTMLQYLNKLYAEGLLNQDYTTFSEDAYHANASDGTAFILLSDWLGREKYYTQALRDAGEPDAEWVPIYPLKGPGGAYLSRISNSPQTMAVAAAAAQKSYFSQLIKWLDWMYSDAGADLFSWGIEGETYTVDTNGNKVPSSSIKTAANPDGALDLGKDYGTSNNCLTFVYPADQEKATMDPTYLALIQKESENHAIPDLEPYVALTKDDLAVRDIYAANLESYVDEMTTRFIMGGASFDDWDSFVRECDHRGADTLCTLYNTAWQNSRQ